MSKTKRIELLNQIAPDTTVIIFTFVHQTIPIKHTWLLAPLPYIFLNQLIKHKHFRVKYMKTNLRVMYFSRVRRYNQVSAFLHQLEWNIDSTFHYGIVHKFSTQKKKQGTFTTRKGEVPQNQRSFSKRIIVLHNWKGLKKLLGYQMRKHKEAPDMFHLVLTCSIH